MAELTNPTPEPLNLKVRQGDTLAFQLMFAGPGGTAMDTAEMGLYAGSNWLFQVRANKPSGRLLGEIKTQGIAGQDGIFRLRCFLPPETSQALIPADIGENYTDLERIWKNGPGEPEQHLTVAAGVVVVTDDVSVPVLKKGV